MGFSYRVDINRCVFPFDENRRAYGMLKPGGSPKFNIGTGVDGGEESHFMTRASNQTCDNGTKTLTCPIFAPLFAVATLDVLWFIVLPPCLFFFFANVFCCCFVFGSFGDTCQVVVESDVFLPASLKSISCACSVCFTAKHKNYRACTPASRLI